ncbi:MAG TPA: group III truncated hemoglobin [Rhizomicrobium sp.]|nr:group III truncated hemoglobin [Rhizomicrobium sp.]
MTTEMSAAERRAGIVQNMIDETGVDEAMIKTLVHTFYGKVRPDPMLGPVFDRAIGDNWDVHLQKMCDFWSSVMLMSGRFKGNPMVAHMRLKTVTPKYFERWLELFAETAHEVCPADAAEAFIARSQNIGRSLQMGMFFRADRIQPGAAKG